MSLNPEFVQAAKVDDLILVSTMLASRRAEVNYKDEVKLNLNKVELNLTMM